MTRTIWLASYPKSGNTWMRALIGNLWAAEEGFTGMNALAGRNASDRTLFDFVILLDSGLLTHDEIDSLRPRAHRAIARGECDFQFANIEATKPFRFMKVHDCYVMSSGGEPLLGGPGAADCAIVMVRDPRDIATSLAHYLDWTVDRAVTFINDDDAALSKETNALENHLRQQLHSWSRHVASWLGQTDIPIHLVRYEDMHEDTIGTLRRALAFAGVPATEEQIKRAVTFCNFARLREQEQQTGFHEASRPSIKFFRRGEVGAWRDELRREQVQRIETRHSRMMLRLGYQLSSVSDLARAG